MCRLRLIGVVAALAACQERAPGPPPLGVADHQQYGACVLREKLRPDGPSDCARRRRLFDQRPLARSVLALARLARRSGPEWLYPLVDSMNTATCAFSYDVVEPYCRARYGVGGVVRE